MDMKQIIAAIADKHQSNGIDVYKPATEAVLSAFEQRHGFALPADFREFYSICNGFGCLEDIFNITPLHEISDYGRNWFYFAEYMINSDMWGLRITAEGNYEIFNGSYPEKAMTSSLEEFLLHYLQGDVFEQRGLYDWQEELGIK